MIGIIPQSLQEAEIGHKGLTRLEVVDGMHARKARMAELADAFIALGVRRIRITGGEPLVRKGITGLLAR
ncbi:LOG family protein, partial [Klebsiella pneumoniae]